MPADDAVLITTDGLRNRTTSIGTGLHRGEAAAHGLAPLCGFSAQATLKAQHGPTPSRPKAKG